MARGCLAHSACPAVCTARWLVRRSGLPGARMTGESTPQASVDELMAFAVDCWPGVSRLPLYRTLESRKRIGPRGMQYMLDQKARSWLRRQSWKYRGV